MPLLVTLVGFRHAQSHFGVDATIRQLLNLKNKITYNDVKCELINEDGENEQCKGIFEQWTLFYSHAYEYFVFHSARGMLLILKKLTFKCKGSIFFGVAVNCSLFSIFAVNFALPYFLVGTAYSLTVYLWYIPVYSFPNLGGYPLCAFCWLTAIESGVSHCKEEITIL